MSESDEEPLYRIGTVSRLTGIPAVTLRMWERRYGVVEPRRTDGRNRLYSRDEIGRLALIKRLVDKGNAISTVAILTVHQLEERLTQFYAEANPLPRCRVLAIGDTLPARLDPRLPELDGLEIVGVYRDSERLSADTVDLRPNVLIVEYPTVRDGCAGEITRLLQRLGAQRAVVIYGFGSREVVRQLDTPRITPLRAPFGLLDLRRVCLGENVMATEPRPVFDLQTPVVPPETIPPMRYPPERLARIANLPTSLHCECPQHVAELLFSLGAFEKYSQECENRNPADAALHHYLHATTAKVRAMMEEALSRVLAAEHIDL